MPSSRPPSEPRSPTLYLHIGAPKTGTSYLQQLIWRNRKRLAEDGVLRPGATRESDFGFSNDHFGAAKDLGAARPATSARMQRPGGWRSITAQVRDWPGASVISAENLASAQPDRIKRARASLESVEVHIVYTARDLARQIPSVWQERLKNREAVSYADFLDGVVSPRTGHPTGARFWNAQDVPAVLQRWSVGIPPERVHVVTVPQSAAAGDSIWDRFASVLGLDPTRYDTDLPSANTSLGAAEAQVLLGLNQSLGKRVRHRDYGNLVKRMLAKEVLAGRSGGVRIALLPQYWEWARARSEQLVQGVRDAGYHVVGDLDDLLLPAPPSGAVAHPDTVDPELVAEAAI